MQRIRHEDTHVPAEQSWHSHPPGQPPPAISVTGLRKTYGTTTAVDSVSFDVADGEIFGILGRNGAGKTTTVECLCGLRRPDRGVVEVLGLNPWRDRARVRTVVGVQLQESVLPDALRVIELVQMYRSFYRDGNDPEALLKDFGLWEKRRTKYSELSGGQQQRLSIVLALIGRPRVAILDELTTGLDPRSRRNVWSLVEALRDSGVTVVLVTHFMEEAERLCDRVAVIEDGGIVALDTPEQLKHESGVDSLEDAYLALTGAGIEVGEDQSTNDTWEMS
ncbi:MAG TPA: ABC transporter ATP-binding protein [Jiangellaceae bacterium]|nr:ABC transporter ATP-binding protein [Jiangellaceae bacterium]